MLVIKSFLAVTLGAALGALLRWLLSKLNAYGPVPLGTLSANLLGGYLVGVALAYYAWDPHIPAWCKLFMITGFCGGLTTFSSFSAEVVALLQQNRLMPAILAVVMHVSGSLTMTVVGMATVCWLRR